MADLTIVAASVIPGAGAQYQSGISGATIVAGTVVYLDAATNTFKLCDANLSLAAATVVGIALHASLAGQPLKVQTAGVIAMGVVFTVGKVYVLSATTGGIIADVGDLAPGWYTALLGIALTTSTLSLSIVNSGIVN